MDKIIIFGACGNIGKYMVDYFLERVDNNFEIIGVDLDHDPYVKSKIELFQLDINDKDAFEVLPTNGVYAIIDLIGPMPARMSGYDPEVYVRTNILGSFNVIQYALKCSADRFLYAKSFSDIIKRAEKEIVLGTDMQPLFDYGSHHSVYTVTQLAASELLKCMHAFYGIKVFIFRLPNIYFWSRNDTYNVNGVSKKIMFRELIDLASEGKPIEVWGDPMRVKDMTYVKDVCQLFYKACFADREYGIYNAGTGVGTSLLKQIEGIIQTFCEDEISPLKMRPDKQNAPQYIMDIAEAVDELGYSPEYTYLKMLEDMKKEKKLARY